MAKGKARGFEALMGWMSGRGVDPDRAEALLRSLPNVESMTPADLKRVIDQMNAPRARMESPVSVEDRVAGNPQTGLRPDGNIRGALQELDPEFYARIDSASPDEILAAYRNAVNKAEGVRRGAPRKGQTRVMDTPVADVPPPVAPARQLELPLGPGAQEPDIRSLIPYGVRGPGVPGELSGPGQILTRQLDMIPAPLRGLPGPAQRRIGTTAGVPMGGVQQPIIDVPFEVVQPARRLPDARQPVPGVPSRAADNLPPGVVDDLADGPPPGTLPRTPDAAAPDGPKMPWGSLGAGVGLGLGLSQMLPEDAFRTPPASGAQPKNSTTADLVEESRPAPKVEATPDVPEPTVKRGLPDVPKPTVKQGPPDYSAQARELIARANDIQRSAGRQTPESIALINQANKLYEMAAEGRRNGSQPAIMPVEQQNRQTSSIQRDARQQVEQNQGSDYRSQARRLMAELNIRSSQGNISSSEYSAMKRRIDELFALADREDNARPQPSGRRFSSGGMGRAQLPGRPKGGPELLRPTPGYQKRRSPSTT